MQFDDIQLVKEYQSQASKSKLLRVREEVAFDPTNPEHQQAYVDLRLRGRQSTKYRFTLEYPFLTIPAMMEFKLSMLACGIDVRNSLN